MEETKPVKQLRPDQLQDLQRKPEPATTRGAKVPRARLGLAGLSIFLQNLILKMKTGDRRHYGSAIFLQRPSQKKRRILRRRRGEYSR